MNDRPPASDRATFDRFRGRRIGVFGAGLEGASTLRQLADERDVVLLVDDPDAETAVRLGAETGRPVIAADRAVDLALDVVVRSAGVRTRHPALVALRRDGVEVTGLLAAWLAAHPDALTIGITGTKGKSTTSQLCADLLSATGMQVALGGNIGVPVVDLPDHADVYVIEVSSYQAADVDRSPRIGVLTSLAEDHLTWHGGRDEYWTDKLNLFAHAGLDRFVTPPEMLRGHPAVSNGPWVARAAPDDGQVELVDGHLLIADRPPVELRGICALAHNARNLQLAVRAARLVREDIDHTQVERVAAAYHGLPSRLEVIAEVDGVRIVDDALASNPFAAIAAIDALDDRPLVLLAGGDDRTVDVAGLACKVRDSAHVRAVVLFSRTRGHWADVFRSEGVPEHRMRVADTDDVVEAATAASDLLAPGTTLLFSPAAATPAAQGTYRDRSAALHRFAARLA